MQASRMLKPRLLLLGLWLWVSACSLIAPKLERPVVSVVSIDWVSGNLMHQNFLVKLNIHNPNDRALPVTSLHADLSVAGERVATGANTQPFVVPAQGDSQFDMTIAANMASVLLKLAGRSDHPSDALDYDLTGTASIDLPLLRDLPFHQRGTLPLRLR